MIAGQQK